MTDSTLKPRLQSDMKSSMKSHDKPRLLVVRLMLAAIKQIEVDERIELDDDRIIAVLDKMTKQRRESIEHFSKASRDDLIAIEEFELQIIREYLPQALSEAEINTLIEQSIEATGAASIKDMGKVIGRLRPQLQGRADMSMVSQLIKSRLVPS
ncbi:MAG: GatB/YqeY domain-containing protein [Gammaproteobacteria bacterium]|nr:GatB/YqeY domain-containing protein [Gammaproteobacteria bacterium]MCZ6486595.1 GatB/YqeY domain-containing protein [Gammaproteobacteria bacterium]MCZ6578484.1 GatB/YqeY domain-containing protein [Gammaproteobacteria bacterium]MCZ6669130.1 GatB/YqeY domain-containing protein [Gammaproteobacteria bacterium]MCZ6724029.1 GatB/YqeY domain-containing protein [Gammaproteobacteria bacterium]